MRRAAVYNAYWRSRGGGERHSAKLAEVLAKTGWDVDLVGHEPFDRDDLAAHLALDLSRCAVRVVPDTGDSALVAASAEYDLFVNATHMSRLAPRARHNVLLCWFPTPLDFDSAPWRRFALRRVAPYVVRRLDGFRYGDTWFRPEGGLRGGWVWTRGDSVLPVPPSGRVSFAVARPEGPPTTLYVRDGDGTEVARIAVGAAFVRHAVRATPGATLRLVSDTYTDPPGETRALGVAVRGLRRYGADRGWRWSLVRRWPWLLVDPGDLTYLDAYDTVLANSEFTRGWVRRLWRRDAAVLFPPVRTADRAPVATREKAVVTVGRFFAPGSGHAKRQYEMVRMFGDLSRAGRLDGWTLHVVGGCEPKGEPYLASVRAAAAGLPVEIHPNAPREVVDRLLDTSAVFWSATGLGESEDAVPWHQEHFGMTTVEAMAGGCVPVVIDRAGQREIVRDGVDGYRWSTPAEWADATERVARDDALRARLAAAAVARAAEFSDAAFERRWAAIAASLGLG